MALINISNAQLAYGDHPLLDKAEFVLQPNERVCLVGRNGAGKSTLMKVIAGEILLDDGSIQRQSELVVSRLEQDPPRDAEGTVFDYVAEGLADVGTLLREYHQQLDLITADPSESNINKLARIQEKLDHANAWQIDTRITQVLESLNLTANTLLTDLSGGWQRKAALARALVCDPDILLLDEPTNHLDVTTIEWLEGFLKEFRGSIIFISHDRAFIRSMATRIVDLDRGQLSSFPGDYEKYLDEKEEQLRVEAEQNAEFDKKLAQEEVWIRQGIKARRTRNEGRVRALKQLRNERSERREVQGKADMQLQEAKRSGKIVFEAENISYSFGDQAIIKDFSFNVMRGDRTALIGPNGCGKSTLLKILLGQLENSGGKFHCGTKLEVAYFDQYREILDPEKTVMDNLADGKQEVVVNGKSRHALGYLQDFLFHPRRARTPVKALSGGEKNRLLLAKLFLKPNNLLVLDEPTNDLDIETLELLEEILANYQGTLLLVSHDRQFVDNTVTTSWIFEGNGVVNEYVGGYHDAQSQRENSLANIAKKEAEERELAKKKEEQQKQRQANRQRSSKKLSYKLQLELDELPAKIEQLENDIAELQEKINDPGFFADVKNDTQAVLTLLAEKEQAFEVAFERWEELEAMQKES
ncbi:ABC transporter ATP-binding protein uup [Photobacterium damselae subsp. piscicida]|uniref:ATP-binding protein Uup n=2 Tax=Photobacterium damselae TaxID=38293 RepID=A0A1V1VBW7_PHODP|nr:ABC transporter ATP-binding protein [Photobacterium damselae]MBE8129292.1 ABC transporter ATP-binding protein [Photobacterium damselae subsp. piscicida]PSV78800.1 ABC transporter ATP-binding protein [Photobacterium damselae]PSW83442.1 ABC transporter ATP-binding protein [Photobacterium damselae]QOD51478.1 ABC transporter ATP-binding protein [Photobacterium damselae subsp. piscicida]QOD55333.1 ABC transporter ATP-binding protein [Photobacterium damselae subsp. piscicida]